MRDSGVDTLQLRARSLRLAHPADARRLLAARRLGPSSSLAQTPEGREMESAQASLNEIACDLCIIGAGPGGLTVASAAAQLGRKVVLIERAAMGGDCLNHG